MLGSCGTLLGQRINTEHTQAGIMKIKPQLWFEKHSEMENSWMLAASMLATL